MRRDRPDGAFDGIGVEFDATVVEEAGEFVPAREGITDCFGQGAAAGDAGEFGFEPRLHGVDQRTGSDVTDLPAVVGRVAADRCLDRIEFCDPA